jgi:hypothetical protein
MGVAIGVDSHKSSLAVGVLDEMGRHVGVREFANDARGHDSLIDWVDDHGPERIIGIEDLVAMVPVLPGGSSKLARTCERCRPSCPTESARRTLLAASQM